MSRSLRLACVVAAGLSLGCRERAVPEPEPREIASPEPARVIELAPAEDRERSPYTGWTRAHYELVFARVLLGFVDHRTPSGARTTYPGGEKLPAAMEGATRMLPGLGAWLSCPCNPDRVSVDGRELDVLAIARAIVLGGTDPASPDYWKPSRGGWDQREVEAAIVAEFLVRSRARFWDQLDVAEQDQIMAWIPAAEQPLEGNWLALQISRNSARLALGYPVPEAALREQLDKLEAGYAGDGFYRDGHQQRFDWYNGLVIHAALSRWRSRLGDGDPERAARVAARTQAFLAQLPWLFDGQGRVAPIGRSLGYRSGVLASLHASVIAGDPFVAPGLARRISAGNLKFHVEAGMFGVDQVLTRGYHGEQPRVIEDYLRPGSQYFATEALTVLALPPEHPFWTATEQPLPADLPADRGDFVHAIPAIGWMIEHDADAAGLVLHNVGSSSSRSKHYDQYAKLGYPAQTWYAHEGAASRPYDAQVISATTREFERRRSSVSEWAVADGFAWTRYAMAPDAGGMPHFIATASIGDPSWTGLGRVRLSCVEPSTAEPARPYEGSYAIALGATPNQLADPLGRWVYLDSGLAQPEPGSGAVLLAGLVGWERAGLQLDEPSLTEHVLGGRGGYVGLGVVEPFTQTRCFASLQALAADPFDPAPILASAPTITFAGTVAVIDGWSGTRAWVELGQKPIERTVELEAVPPTKAGEAVPPTKAGEAVHATGPIRLLWVGEHQAGVRVVAIGVRSLQRGTQELLDPAAEPLASLDCVIRPRATRCVPIELSPRASPADPE